MSNKNLILNDCEFPTGELRVFEFMDRVVMSSTGQWVDGRGNNIIQINLDKESAKELYEYLKAILDKNV